MVSDPANPTLAETAQRLAGVEPPAEAPRPDRSEDCERRRAVAVVDGSAVADDVLADLLARHAHADGALRPADPATPERPASDAVATRFDGPTDDLVRYPNIGYAALDALAVVGFDLALSGVLDASALLYLDAPDGPAADVERVVALAGDRHRTWLREQLVGGESPEPPAPVVD